LRIESAAAHALSALEKSESANVSLSNAASSEAVAEHAAAASAAAGEFDDVATPMPLSGSQRRSASSAFSSARTGRASHLATVPEKRSE